MSEATAPTVKQTPSEKLGALTVDRLIKAGLLRKERRAALTAKVGGGTMSGADWRNEIDLAALKDKA